MMLTLIKSKVQFSNMVSVVRSNLMNYVNIYSFLENPEGCLQAIMRENAQKYQNELSLFYENRGLTFENH
jgi:hypothetical protein